MHSPSAITFSTKGFCISDGRGRSKGFSLLPKFRLLETLESGFVAGRGVFEGAAALGEMVASEGTPLFILFEELKDAGLLPPLLVFLGA